MRRRPTLLLIAALGTLFRLLLLFLLPESTLSGDAAGYWVRAESLLATGLLGVDGVPSALRLPGYPLFLAAIQAVGGGISAALAAQALIEGGSILLIGVLATHLSPALSSRAPLVAASAWAIYPFAVRSSLAVLSESLTVFLFLLFLYLVASRWRSLRAVGFLGGLAMIALVFVKPTFLFFLPCWGIYLLVRWPALYRRVVVRRWLLLLFVFGLVYSAWPIRNQLQFGRLVFGATNFGRSFFNGIYGDGTLGSESDFRAVEFGAGGASTEERLRRAQLLAPLQGLDEIDYNRALTDIAFRLASEDPVHFVRNAALTVPRLWLRFPWEWPPTLRGLLLSLIQILWLFAAASGWLWIRSRVPDKESSRVLFISIEAVVIYMTGVHFLTTPVVRYALPAVAALCPLVGVSFRWCRK